MATLTCCGNQPTPIVIGLLVTYSIGLIQCYPLYGSTSSLPSSIASSSPASSSGNINLGQIVYRPSYNLASSLTSSSSSLPSSSPISSSSSSSSLPVAPSQKLSQQPPSSASISSSSLSSSSPSQSLTFSSLNHHPSLPGGLTLIRGNSLVSPSGDDSSLRRPSNTYHDYYDTLRLPVITPERERISDNSGNLAGGRFVVNGLPNGLGSGNAKQRIIFAQPSTSPIDFDYVPFIQSDFNPSSSLSSAFAAAVSSPQGSERSGDLYEEADYNDPLYDLKYDPIEDSNWFNEAVSSSYRQAQQQQQQQQQSVLPSVPYITSSSDNSAILSPSNSDELLTNLMVTFLKELQKSAQQSSSPSLLSSQSTEPVQHLFKLQKQQQQQPNIEGIKSYENYGIEKKSMNRDKGIIKSGDKKESAKRIEQQGQKEFAMLRPTVENNGKDEIDSSLSSQLHSVSVKSGSSSTTTTTERSDEEVNQLRSLLQSA